MAITTAAQVLALIAPTLYALASSGDYLGLSVRAHVSADKIGATYPELIAYHCAHSMTMALSDAADYTAGRPSAPGPVTSLRSGDLGITYGTPSGRGGISAQDEEYLTTRYGRKYLSLRDALPRTAARVLSPDPSVGVTS